MLFYKSQLGVADPGILLPEISTRFRGDYISAVVMQEVTC
jgi:hypothetical protein